MKTDKGINIYIDPKLRRQPHYQNEIGWRQQFRIYCAAVLREANESSSHRIWNKLLPRSVTACKVRVSYANTAPAKQEECRRIGVEGVLWGDKAPLTCNELSQAELCALCPLC